MGFLDLYLTDYYGNKIYNITKNEWLKDYPEDYKQFMIDSYKVTQHRMYKLIALLGERERYMIGLLDVFQATLARDLNDKDYKFVAKLIEVQRRHTYSDDIYLGILFAYMHKPTQKAMRKIVFSDKIDSYDEENFRVILFFAANFIDATEYLDRKIIPGEVFDGFWQTGKIFYRTFVEKQKSWKPYLKKGSYEANSTNGGYFAIQNERIYSCYCDAKKMNSYDFLSTWADNQLNGFMLYKDHKLSKDTTISSSTNFGYGIVYNLRILAWSSGDWESGATNQFRGCKTPDNGLINSRHIPIERIPYNAI